jgi:hypothetical protein
MTRRKVRSAGKEPASKHGANKGVVDEEVSFGEEKKNLVKAEFMFLESKPAQQLRSGLIIKDEDSSDSWYFTHV